MTTILGRAKHALYIYRHRGAATLPFWSWIKWIIRGGFDE